MASDLEFVEFIADQIGGPGVVSYRKMFGEYVVYFQGKVVALVCDNRVYVKPTAGGRAFIGDVVEAPAYPGAKLSFLIEDRFEDRDWFSSLIKITAAELPSAKTIKRAKPEKDRVRS